MFSKTAKSTLRALFRRYVQRYLWLALFTALSMTICYIAPLLWTSAKARFLDVLQTRTLFALRGPLPPPDDVVILAIDDRTFHSLGISPNSFIPRAKIAEAFEALSEAAPRAFIMDTFALPDSRDPEADERIAQALSNMPSTIALGTYGSSSGKLEKDLLFETDSKFTAAARFQLTMEFDREQDVVWFLGKPRDDSTDPQVHFPLLAPLTKLANYAVRPPSPYTLVNFYGPAGTIPHIGLHELLSDTSRADALTRLKNKVIFFGTQRSTERDNALFGKDSFSISYSTGAMFGVEVWAHMGGNLIDGSYIRRLSPTGEIALIFTFTLLTCFLLLFSPTALNFVLAFVLWLLYGISSYIAFSSFKLFLPAVFFLFLSTTLIAVIGISIEKLRIRLFRKIVKEDLGLDLRYGKV